MSTKEKENIKKVKQLKNKIINSNKKIANCKETIAYLDNEKKNETESCLKMIKIFGEASIFCIIVAGIIGETFIILPGIFPIGIGLPSASIYLAIETLLIHKNKKKQEKIIANTEVEKNNLVKELETLLESIKKQELADAKETLNLKSDKSHQNKKDEEIINSLVSDFIEAKRYGILDETLHNKYHIFDPEIIDLCKEIVAEELEQQRTIFQIENNLQKVHTR